MDSNAPIHIHTAADLIAAIPALLGHTPSESVVVIYTSGGTACLLARADLDTLRQPAARRLLVTPALPFAPVTAHIVLIAATPATPAGVRPGQRPPHAELISVLRATLTDAGISVARVLWAAAARAGARWRSYDNPAQTGWVPDPAASTAAAAAVASGRVIHPDKESMAAVLRPDPEPALAARAALIATRQPPPPADGARLVDHALDQARRGRYPDQDTHLADLAVALSQGTTRDYCLTYCLSNRDAGPAEQLWTALTRALPAPHRAAPATALAATAYLRGDGVMATLAIQVALRVDPDYSLARLLLHSLLNGARPDDIRQVIAACAADPTIQALARERPGTHQAR